LKIFSSVTVRLIDLPSSHLAWKSFHFQLRPAVLLFSRRKVGSIFFSSSRLIFLDSLDVLFLQEIRAVSV